MKKGISLPINLIVILAVVVIVLLLLVSFSMSSIMSSSEDISEEQKFRTMCMNFIEYNCRADYMSEDLKEYCSDKGWTDGQCASACGCELKIGSPPGLKNDKNLYITSA